MGKATNDTYNEALDKFENAISFLRERAELSLHTETGSTSVLFKLNIRSTGDKLTQNDVIHLRAALTKVGFEDIRIPELTAPSPRLVCIADFPTNGGTTIADLISFVTRNRDVFPDGLATRLTLGDFEGNELHNSFEMQADNKHLALLF